MTWAKLTKSQTERCWALYREMPGAPTGMMEDVIGNDHWAFCEVIVRTIDKQVGAAINGLADAS